MSIHEVAKAAKVSAITVSRVINGGKLVSAETARRVKTAMAKLGYTPPPPEMRRGPKRASSSTGASHRTLAFLWTGRPFRQGSAPSPAAENLYHGVQDALAARGIHLVMDFLPLEGSLPRAIGAGKVDGIFLQGPDLSDQQTAALRHVPTMWVFFQGSHLWGDRVQPDHRAAGHHALDYLLGKGCARVGCFTNHPTWKAHTPWTERTGAFTEAAKWHEIPCQVWGEDRDALPSDPMMLPKVAQDWVALFLAHHPRPEGLFVANRLGPWIRQELHRVGVIPGRDVHLVLGDRDPERPALEEDCATFEIHGRRIGFLAAEGLLWRLAHPDFPRTTLMVEPTLLPPTHDRSPSAPEGKSPLPPRKRAHR